MEAQGHSEPVAGAAQEAFNEQYFRRVIASLQKTVSKVRKIDVEELLELAWVDGMLEPFAERLLRSRPDLGEDVERTVRELKQSAG